MERPRRLRQPRLLRRDWIGDGVLTLLAGAVLVVAVFLPWANEDRPGQVNYSLSMPDGINGILGTQWGAPALVLALAVVCLAVFITVTTPRRFSFVLGVLVAACGVAVIGVGRDAASALGWWSPGLGMYLTVLAGVLLVPIGLAAALVAWILVRTEGRTSHDPPTSQTPPPTAPPAPESAPPT
jgi:hypothetical protein